LQQHSAQKLSLLLADLPMIRSDLRLGRGESLKGLGWKPTPTR